MKDQDKTKAQLIEQLARLRQQVAQYKASQAERNNTEQALNEPERRYRALYETSHDGIAAANLDGRITECNQAYADMLGYTREELKRLTYQQITPPRWHAFNEEMFRQVMQRGYSTEFEKEYIRKDGTILPVSLRTWRIDDEAGNPTGVWSIVRDITERKKAEEKLHAFQRRLRSLAHQTSLSEDRERRRVVDGLHEQVGQPLATSKLKIGDLRELLPSSDLCQQLDEIGGLIDQAIQEAQSLTFHLSHPILYDLGLEAALKYLVEQVQREYGIRCTFDDDDQPKPLGDDLCGLLLWNVRELLMNVAKHAKAKTAKVSTWREGDEVRLRVEDDGVGFDDTSKTERGSRGFALFSIRQRLGEFGGRLEVESKPGRGTRVTISTPLQQ